MTAPDSRASVTDRLTGRARLVDTAYRVVSLLPLRAIHALGTLTGSLGALVPNIERHVARVNAELCFPDWSLADRKRLVRETLRESAKGLLEISYLWYRPIDRVRARVRSVEGADLFDAALAEGRGLLIIAPHLGCWEILQMWVAERGPSNALYRPPRQPDLEPLLNRGRSRSGMRFWAARPSGIRGLLKALKAGEIVGLLPDQQPPGEGVFAPFFGVEAKTMTLFSRLAARSGAAVVVGWAERLPKGAGYRLHWRRVEDEVDSDDPVRAAAAMNRAIEGVVRDCPAQYQWTYRRFARRPDGTRNYYRRWRSTRGWVEPID